MKIWQKTILLGDFDSNSVDEAKQMALSQNSSLDIQDFTEKDPLSFVGMSAMTEASYDSPWFDLTVWSYSYPKEMGNPFFYAVSHQEFVNEDLLRVLKGEISPFGLLLEKNKDSETEIYRSVCPDTIQRFNRIFRTELESSLMSKEDLADHFLCAAQVLLHKLASSPDSVLPDAKREKLVDMQKCFGLVNGSPEVVFSRAVLDELQALAVNHGYEDTNTLVDFDDLSYVYKKLKKEGVLSVGARMAQAPAMIENALERFVVLQDEHFVLSSVKRAMEMNPDLTRAVFQSCPFISEDSKIGSSLIKGLQDEILRDSEKNLDIPF